MSSNGNQVPLAPNHRAPSTYPFQITENKRECYLQPSGAGGGYLGGPAPPQPGLRAQQPPQAVGPASAHHQEQRQGGGAYGPSATSAAPRASYTGYYRPPQHTQRPAAHATQQQQPSYMSNSAASSSGPMLYHPLVFQPAHMGLPQTYQQPRSQGFYPAYLPYPMSYGAPATHQSPYYYQSNSQPLTSSLQGNGAGASRSNPSPLMTAQGTASSPSPSSSLPHPQTSSHQPMSGVPPQPVPKKSHRLPIIDPKTNQEVIVDTITKDSSVASTVETTDSQTTQPSEITTSAATSTSSIAEQFSRMVAEAASQPSVSELTDSESQDARSRKYDRERTASASEKESDSDTPVVSAISDSPIIVPKMPIPKQPYKAEGQSAAAEAKSASPHKKSKVSKPHVPVVSDEDVVSARSSEPAKPKGLDSPKQDQLPKEVETTKEVPKVEKIVKSISLEQKETSEELTNVPNGPAEGAPRCEVTLPEPVADAKTDETKVEAAVGDGKTDAISVSDDVSDAAVVADESANKTTKQAVEKTTKQAVEKTTKEAVEKMTTEAADKTTKDAADKSTMEAVVADSAKEGVEMRARTEVSAAVEADGSGDAQANEVDGEVVADSKTDDVACETDTSIKEIDSKSKEETNTSASESTAPIAAEAILSENGNQTTAEIVADAKDSDKETTQAVEAVEVDRPVAFIPKYKYELDQWSPINKNGRKCYKIDFLKQLRDDPLSKDRPNAPMLAACNVLRTAPLQESILINQMMRSNNDALFPPFLKGALNARNTLPRENKRDPLKYQGGFEYTYPAVMNAANKMLPIKLPQMAGNSNPHQKLVIHVSLREEVKLNESENAWKPSRFKSENVSEDEAKTQELYKKFRGILNKLTPQKFNTLLDKVRNLEIDNQKRLEGVIDLVFEKAIDEPNFSEAYAAMCNKLSTLKVPADNPTTPDQMVNFRALIITRCQNQFDMERTDERVVKLEREIEECADATKKKEMQLQLEEENRRVRMRSVGNVRFIGELYKLKMLTTKIICFCMKKLTERVEEEKLECLCKLLTTIGEQVEVESRSDLDKIFNTMQEIVHKKSNNISSRVRFMIQDVIELRKRRWVVKSVFDSAPKMMDQIQKEADQQQRHIELMNASASYRREESSRGKRGADGGGRRAGPSHFEAGWKPPQRTSYVVDTSKLKAVTQAKNITNIKLAPHSWNQGQSAKSAALQPSTTIAGKNMYSVLENSLTDPTNVKGGSINKENAPSLNHTKGASIERSTFDHRNDIVTPSSSRSGSITLAASDEGKISPQVVDTPPGTPSVVQEQLPDDKKKRVRSMVELAVINRDDDMSYDISNMAVAYHTSMLVEMITLALDMSPVNMWFLAGCIGKCVESRLVAYEHFEAALAEFTSQGPDLFIDIPVFYEFLGKMLAPLVERNVITFVQIMKISDEIIAAEQGHLLLKALFKEMRINMGPSFVRCKWQESSLTLAQWMNPDKIDKWIKENKFEYLNSESLDEDIRKILTPADVQAKLLQMMDLDESCDCIKGWVQDNVGNASREEWFARALAHAVCEHASRGAGQPRLRPERLGRYARLVGDAAAAGAHMQLACLHGVQRLLHTLEHPKGLALDIFQYLHEQYLISVETFIEWEESEKEPEGKGVILKALTSFFTNIKEADNEESSSEG